jgi:hypothetical protein
MTIGYLFRMLMIHHPRQSYFVAMQMLLVIPPIVLAAVLYACLGGLLSSGWIPVVFVIVDIVCFIVQMIGVKGLTSTDKTQFSNGLIYLVSGMALAVLANVIFLFLIFAYIGPLYATVAPILITLLVLATIFMLVRNVYRLQEFVVDLIRTKDNDGSDSITAPKGHSLPKGSANEKLFYLLDFGALTLVVLILAVFQCLV